MPFINGIGAPELIIILIIALIVVGPGRLPDVGSALGKSIREFRKAATDVKDATSLEEKPQSGPGRRRQPLPQPSRRRRPGSDDPALPRTALPVADATARRRRRSWTPPRPPPDISEMPEPLPAADEQPTPTA